MTNECIIFDVGNLNKFMDGGYLYGRLESFNENKILNMKYDIEFGRITNLELDTKYMKILIRKVENMIEVRKSLTNEGIIKYGNKDCIGTINRVKILNYSKSKIIVDVDKIYMF